jgi:hypothetical protein
VTNISGLQLCDEITTKRLIQISENIGLPRYEVSGMLTDVLAIKSNNMCQNAVNMTCGYWNSIGAQKNEYIDIQEVKDTMQYVSSVIQYYDLEEYKNEKVDDDLEKFSVNLFGGGEEHEEYENYWEAFEN